MDVGEIGGTMTSKEFVLAIYPSAISYESGGRKPKFGYPTPRNFGFLIYHVESGYVEHLTSILDHFSSEEEAWDSAAANINQLILLKLEE